MLNWAPAISVVGAAYFLVALGYTNKEGEYALTLEEQRAEDPSETVVSINSDAPFVKPVMRSEGNADIAKQKVSLKERADTTMQMLEARRDEFEHEATKEFERSLEGKWVDTTGMPTSQSSTEFNGVSSRATDGNLATHWSSQTCTHTKREDNAWWKLDMTQPYHISKVKVVNRADTVGWEIAPFNVEIDETPCQSSLSLADGETKDLPCPMVGTEVKVHAPLRTASQANKWEQRRVLMLCEVKIKATQRSLLERGSAQCMKHAVVAQLVVTPNATDGWCMPDTSSSGRPLKNASASLNFKEKKVGRVIAPGGDLEASRSECEEHLLKSDESVRGAVWKKHSVGSAGKDTMGVCNLLSGPRIAGAKHVPGAFCMRKLTCPKNMDYWRARAGLGKRAGSLLNDA